VARHQKKAQDEERTLVWVDESAFYLLPDVVRTWAPRGETPLLRAPCTRDHLAAISGITLAGRLLMQVQRQAFRGPTVVRFLNHLLRHVPGKLLVLWDGARIHHGTAVQAFLAAGGAERLHLETLPAYAPELNPDEGIWQYLKHVELRNLVCEDLPELQAELRRAVARLRHKRHVVQGCIAQVKYVV
jgi:transposase